MKLSDKALKLIGRIVLGSTAGDSTDAPVDTPRFSLDLQAPVEPAKAPVLPFPKRDPDQ